MTDSDSPPFLVLTVLLDASARPAAITRSHGDALERAMKAASGQTVAGMDLVELPIAKPAFDALKKHLRIAPDAIGLYDIFPLASHLDLAVRKVAGQFLAAEALWTLEEQGQLGGVPLNVQLDLPDGWDKAPQAVHARLVAAGALELSPRGIETFKVVKSTWDAANV
jgi:hypothetical protein